MSYKYWTIGTYEMAAKLYDETKAIRGQNKDEVGIPLRVDRRYWKWDSLRKFGDEYSTMIGSHRFVTWRPNGGIVVDLRERWVSQTPIQMLEDVLPFVGARTSSGNTVFSMPLRRFAARQQKYFANNGASGFVDLVVKDDILHLVKTPTGYRVPAHTLRRAKKRTVNRKRAAKVQKFFAPMFEFFHLYTAMPMSRELQQKLRGKSSRYGVWREAVRSKKLPDETQWASVAAWHHDALWHYIGPGQGFSVSQEFNMRSAKGEAYAEAYQEAKCYDYEPIPPGALPKDLRNVVFE